MQPRTSTAPPPNHHNHHRAARGHPVLVTGMLMRWIRVRPRPMAIGAKPLRALVGGPEDDGRHQRHHDLAWKRPPPSNSRLHEHRGPFEAKPEATLKPALPLAIRYNTPASGDPAQYLGDDVGRPLLGPEPAARPQTDGHRPFGGTNPRYGRLRRPSSRLSGRRGRPPKNRFPGSDLAAAPRCRTRPTRPRKCLRTQPQDAWTSKPPRRLLLFLPPEYSIHP